MSTMSLLLVGIFLPLFPLSMLFNRVLARVGNTGLRMALLLGWPAVGVALLWAFAERPPDWVVYWGLLTALLYGFRALALRDLALWLGYIATSAWSLIWMSAAFAESAPALLITLAAFSLPLALLAWLTGVIERSIGAAYAGVSGGLATALPRLAGLLVMAILAAIGTPLFPGFFAMIGIVNGALSASPLAAVGVLVVWMLWAWAGMRMLQGLVVGRPDGSTHRDIGGAHTGVLGVTLAAFAITGIWLSGGLV